MGGLSDSKGVEKRKITDLMTIKTKNPSTKTAKKRPMLGFSNSEKVNGVGASEVVREVNSV